MVQLEGELGALAAGEPPGVEPLTAELEALLRVIGADGVMVPVRPHPRTAKGKTRWRETKVAILARLGARLSHEGTRVSRLCQRRLVAVLGAIDDLAPRFWLEAVRQGVRTAMRVVWLSDGAGFVERIPVPLPGGRGSSDFRLLPCSAKSVQRRQRLA